MANPFDTSKYPTEHPECIILGGHIGWRLAEDFDAADYTLRYDLHKVGEDPVDGVDVQITGSRQTIDGTLYWVFEVESSVSSAAPWTDEFAKDTQCRWNLVVVRNSDDNEAVYQSGFLRVYTSTSDRRTHAEIMLSKITSILEDRADHDVNSYSIKSRSISRMTVAELTRWRDYYLSELRRTGGSVNEGGPAIKQNTLQIRFVE